MSDKKFGVISDTNSSLIDHYEADIVNATDYYPFGMPSRVSLTGKGYRFGFNGQEMSNDIKGFGNSYTAEFWEYDSRIGRRWNLDPKPITGISEYSTFNSNPILNSDPRGDSSIRPLVGQKGFVDLAKYKAGALPDEGNILNRLNAAANNLILAPIANLTIDAVDAVANPGWTLYNLKDFLVNSATAFGKWSENNPDRIAGVSAALTSAMTYAKDNMTNPDAQLQFATMAWSVFGGPLIGSKINLSKDFTLKSSKVAESVSSPYEGVRAASKYLQEQGVPRGYRKHILQSFEVETISLKVADNATFGLRFYGGAASQSGRYIFPTFTNYTNRIGLALPPRWNSMSGMSQFQVAPGSTYIFGRAASQGGIYTGGSFQMYINNLNDLYKLH